MGQIHAIQHIYVCLGFHGLYLLIWKRGVVIIISNNVETFSTLPELSIQTTTGFGAIIIGQLAPRPSYQGEIRQIIDCITPRNGIVGFVNGEPYYGPFHIHPTAYVM